jgi:hypothetical protein
MVQVTETNSAGLDIVKVMIEDPGESSGLERSRGLQQSAHGETVIRAISESLDNEKQSLSKESRKSTDTLNSTPLEYPKYNLIAGYYIVMGGFVTRCDFDSDGDIEPKFSGKHFRTLSPEAVEVLATAGHFLPVQTRTVHDT